MPGIDRYTTLMLHYDGANGAQSFPDSSFYNHTINVLNTYQTQTSVVKFGTAAGQPVTANDGVYLSAPLFADADVIFGTDDFTIDFWINIANTTLGFFCDWRPVAEGNYPTLYYSGGVLIYYTASANRIVGGTAVSINTWHHIALARASGNTKLFLDGVQEGATFVDGTNYTSGINRPIIGNDSISGTNAFSGFMDEFRISKGLARWTTTFTPPVQPYDGSLGFEQAFDNSEVSKIVSACKIPKMIGY